MRFETKTVRIGEWLGDVPNDWNYGGFHAENLGQPKHLHDKAVSLFKEMTEALANGKTVYATNNGGFSHKVYKCGLYDGWVFWKPRPCYAYEGPIPGEHIDEYYNIRSIQIVEK